MITWREEGPCIAHSSQCSMNVQFAEKGLNNQQFSKVFPLRKFNQRMVARKVKIWLCSTFSKEAPKQRTSWMKVFLNIT